MIKQIVIMLVGLALFALNVAIANEAIRTQDRESLGHQFHDALVDTPKEAVVNAAVATKELVTSSAAHDLKEAGKHLVVDTSVKTAHALQNATIEGAHKVKDGASKAFDATKNVAYKISDATKEVAHKVSDATKDAAHKVSDATKDSAYRVYDLVVLTPAHAIREIASHIKDAGQKACNATANGARKAYYVCIQRPANALRETVHAATCPDKNPEISRLVRELLKAGQNMYVAVIDTDYVNEDGNGHKHTHLHRAKGLIILPEAIAQNTAITVAPNTNAEHPGLQLYVESPLRLAPDGSQLSPASLTKVAIAYNSIQDTDQESDTAQ